VRSCPFYTEIRKDCFTQCTHLWCDVMPRYGQLTQKQWHDLFQELTGAQKDWPDDVRKSFWTRAKNRGEVFRWSVHGMVNGIDPNLLTEWFINSRVDGRPHEYYHQWTQNNAMKAAATVKYVYTTGRDKYHGWDVTLGRSTKGYIPKGRWVNDKYVADN